MHIEQDLQYVEAMALSLKDYILSDLLYWSLGSTSLQGTLGRAVLKLRKLNAQREEMTAEQRDSLQAAQERIDEQFESWQVQAEQKALREIHSRINLWVAYLDETSENPNRHIDEYPQRVAERAILDLLLPVAAGLADEEDIEDRLNGLDRRLKAITEPCDFVWDPDVEEAFPRDPFWYLYVTPVAEEE